MVAYPLSGFYLLCLVTPRSTEGPYLLLFVEPVQARFSSRGLMPPCILCGGFAPACALRNAGVLVSSALAGPCQGVPWADHPSLPFLGFIWSVRLPPGIVGGLAGGVLSAASLDSYVNLCRRGCPLASASWVSI